MAIGRQVARRRCSAVMTARSVDGSVPTIVGVVGAAVGQGDGDRRVGAGAGDDVVVGEDVALVVDDDARALAAALAAS